jgi:tetratricopeptide (TPR) repeat protein
MKYRLLAISLFLLLSSCAQAPPSKEQLALMSVDEINEQAVKLWKDGRYSDPNLAIEYADAALVKNPKYGRAYYTKGFAYYNLKKYELSIDNFSKAIEIDPHIQESYNGRGWVYLEQKQYQNAINDFSKSIGIDNNYALPVNNRGYAYLQLNDLQKACIDLKRACDLGSCSVYRNAQKENKCK